MCTCVDAGGKDHQHVQHFCLFAVLCCAVPAQQVEPRVASGSQGDDDITAETLEPFRKISTMPSIAAGEGRMLGGGG
jgi:hypothetical protein